MRVPTSIKYALKSFSNIHHQGAGPNIFLFATARGGSTWVMEIIASQPGMKYFDEPFNIRRDNVARTGLFPDWESLMPDTGDPERIVDYLNALAAGRHRHMNPPPFRRNHRFRTDRVVFKIHELEHLIGLVAQRCNGMVLYLLRHPVPTTLSRRVLPRLDLFLRSDYYARLIGDRARLAEIRAIGTGGSHLQRGTVSWCYENLVPLQHRDFDGLFVSYEEFVLNPDRSADLLQDRLHLPDREALGRAFRQAASNIGMSQAETRSVMSAADEARRRRHLIARWQERVSLEDAREVTRILGLFGLDVYTGEALLPASRFLHFDDTERLLGEISAEVG